MTTDHRVLALLRGLGRIASHALRKNRHAEGVRQHGCDLLSLVQRSDDQQTAAAFVSDGGHRFWFRQVRCGQQRGHLGAGAGRVAAPAAGLADVDEFDGRDGTHRLLGKFSKQALFLGAGDHHVVAGLDGLLKRSGLPAA